MEGAPGCYERGLTRGKGEGEEEDETVSGRAEGGIEGGCERDVAAVLLNLECCVHRVREVRKSGANTGEQRAEGPG
eukprot:2364059-Rhodomonas_salina.4